ncbi:MAG: ATP-binding cassette domain-containing protein [Gammaproteobacteria bacterium]|nr:ATP-binding cassette domain-containing protein [Gammaproteobacteria bacterium]
MIATPTPDTRHEGYNALLLSPTTPEGRSVTLINCTDLSIAFGEHTVLDHANLAVEKGERLCVTGRNGTGKSTLLKILGGAATPDSGSIWRAPGLVMSELAQELPPGDDVTVYETVAGAFAETGTLLADYHRLLEQMETGSFDTRQQETLGRLQTQIDHADGWSFDHKIEGTLQRFGLEGSDRLSTLSGGWRRRVALARSLVIDPDVWLLDEPTNHLDIPTIEWLEERLIEWSGTLVFVTHDRRLMEKVATSIVDIDRAQVTRWDCDYHTFIERKAHQLEVEAHHQAEFDKRLAKEEAWIREGIKARRTRNEGRVRSLEKMREERGRRRTTGSLNLEADAGEKSGKLVKVVEGVSKAYDGKTVIRDLDLIIQRGDRIGILGPNGAGKTTLLRLLLEKEAPDTGTIRTGTRLDVAYFDQIRDHLDGDKTVRDTITEGREFIEINGKRTHVVSWLGNFMFTPEKARAPVRVLSGGEKNRLMLAKLFSLPANLLVMDEPTNDLDIESLELLEELMIEYTGTVLLVTHDRAFLDNVVSSLLVFEGGGVVREHVGGYADWVARGGRFPQAAREATPAGPQPATDDFEVRKADKRKRQQRERELDALPAQIEAIEKKIEALHEQMANPDFYDGPEDDRLQAQEALAAAEAERDRLFARWEALESASD